MKRPLNKYHWYFNQYIPNAHATDFVCFGEVEQNADGAWTAKINTPSFTRSEVWPSRAGAEAWVEDMLPSLVDDELKKMREDIEKFSDEYFDYA